MKVIIAGGRNFNDEKMLFMVMSELQEAWEFGRGCVLEVFSGAARGADTLGEAWADDQGLDVYRFPADWDKHGRGAGYMRNKEMAEEADALVAFWDGKSRGTKHMIDVALSKGLEVHVYRYSDV